MPISFHLLSSFSLLKSLPPETLLRLSTQMSLRSFSRREMVLAKDKPSQDLCFLIEGRVQGVDFTVDGRDVGLYFVEPGDYFGELTVIDGKGQSEYVVAAVKSEVAFLPGDAARELIFSTPELARAVMTRLTTRVRVAMAQRTLLGLPNPFQRLCVQLLQLSREQTPGQQVVDSVPTHQELAIMINVSRETVTRAFQVLQAQHILRREGNQLQLEDLRYLTDVAEGRKEPPKTS
jgi:CRP/FNR family cyclic AMP-dependent transcriptional regulator